MSQHIDSRSGLSTPDLHSESSLQSQDSENNSDAQRQSVVLYSARDHGTSTGWRRVFPGLAELEATMQPNAFSSRYTSCSSSAGGSLVVPTTAVSAGASDRFQHLSYASTWGSDGGGRTARSDITRTSSTTQTDLALLLQPYTLLPFVACDSILEAYNEDRALPWQACGPSRQPSSLLSRRDTSTSCPGLATTPSTELLGPPSLPTPLAEAQPSAPPLPLPPLPQPPPCEENYHEAEASSDPVPTLLLEGPQAPSGPPHSQPEGSHPSATSETDRALEQAASSLVAALPRSRGHHDHLQQQHRQALEALRSSLGHPARRQGDAAATAGAGAAQFLALRSRSSGSAADGAAAREAQLQAAGKRRRSTSAVGEAAAAHGLTRPVLIRPTARSLGGSCGSGRSAFSLPPGLPPLRDRSVPLAALPVDRAGSPPTSSAGDTAGSSAAAAAAGQGCCGSHHSSSDADEQPSPPSGGPASEGSGLSEGALASVEALLQAAVESGALPEPALGAGVEAPAAEETGGSAQPGRVALTDLAGCLCLSLEDPAPVGTGGEAPAASRGGSRSSGGGAGGRSSGGSLRRAWGQEEPGQDRHSVDDGGGELQGAGGEGRSAKRRATLHSRSASAGSCVGLGFPGVEPCSSGLPSGGGGAEPGAAEMAEMAADVGAALPPAAADAPDSEGAASALVRSRRTTADGEPGSLPAGGAVCASASGAASMGPGPGGAGSVGGGLAEMLLRAALSQRAEHTGWRLAVIVPPAVAEVVLARRPGLLGGLRDPIVIAGELGAERGAGAVTAPGGTAGASGQVSGGGGVLEEERSAACRRSSEAASIMVPAITATAGAPQEAKDQDEAPPPAVCESPIIPPTLRPSEERPDAVAFPPGPEQAISGQDAAATCQQSHRTADDDDTDADAQSQQQPRDPEPPCPLTMPHGGDSASKGQRTEAGTLDSEQKPGEPPRPGPGIVEPGGPTEADAPLASASRLALRVLAEDLNLRLRIAAATADEFRPDGSADPGCDPGCPLCGVSGADGCSGTALGTTSQRKGYTVRVPTLELATVAAQVRAVTLLVEASAQAAAEASRHGRQAAAHGDACEYARPAERLAAGHRRQVEAPPQPPLVALAETLVAAVESWWQRRPAWGPCGLAASLARLAEALHGWVAALEGSGTVTEHSLVSRLETCSAVLLSAPAEVKYPAGAAAVVAGSVVPAEGPAATACGALAATATVSGEDDAPFWEEGEEPAVDCGAEEDAAGNGSAREGCSNGPSFCDTYLDAVPSDNAVTSSGDADSPQSSPSAPEPPRSKAKAQPARPTEDGGCPAAASALRRSASAPDELLHAARRPSGGSAGGGAPPTPTGGQSARGPAFKIVRIRYSRVDGFPGESVRTVSEEAAMGPLYGGLLGALTGAGGGFLHPAPAPCCGEERVAPVVQDQDQHQDQDEAAQAVVIPTSAAGREPAGGRRSAGGAPLRSLVNEADEGRIPMAGTDRCCAPSGGSSLRPAVAPVDAKPPGPECAVHSGLAPSLDNPASRGPEELSEEPTPESPDAPTTAGGHGDDDSGDDSPSAEVPAGQELSAGSQAGSGAGGGTATASSSPASGASLHRVPQVSSPPPQHGVGAAPLGREEQDAAASLSTGSEAVGSAQLTAAAVSLPSEDGEGPWSAATLVPSAVIGGPGPEDSYRAAAPGMGSPDGTGRHEASKTAESAEPEPSLAMEPSLQALALPECGPVGSGGVLPVIRSGTGLAQLSASTTSSSSSSEGQDTQGHSTPPGSDTAAGLGVPETVPESAPPPLDNPHQWHPSEPRRLPPPTPASLLPPLAAARRLLLRARGLLAHHLLPASTAALVAGTPGPAGQQDSRGSAAAPADAAEAAAHADRMLGEAVTTVTPLVDGAGAGPDAAADGATQSAAHGPSTAAAALLACQAHLLRGVVALWVHGDGLGAADAAEAAEGLLLRSPVEEEGSQRLGLRLAAAEAEALQGAVREARGQLYGALRRYEEALDLCREDSQPGAVPPAPPTAPCQQHLPRLLLRAALVSARARCTVRLAALIPFAAHTSPPLCQQQQQRQARPAGGGGGGGGGVPVTTPGTDGSRACLPPTTPPPADPWAEPLPIPWYALARPFAGDLNGIHPAGAAPDVDGIKGGSSGTSTDRAWWSQLVLPSPCPPPCPRVAAAAATELPLLVAEFRAVCDVMAAAAAAGAGAGAASGGRGPPRAAAGSLLDTATAASRTGAQGTQGAPGAAGSSGAVTGHSDDEAQRCTLTTLSQLAFSLVRLQLLAASGPELLPPCGRNSSGVGCSREDGEGHRRRRRLLLLRQAAAVATAAMRWMELSAAVGRAAEEVAGEAEARSFTGGCCSGAVADAALLAAVAVAAAAPLHHGDVAGGWREVGDLRLPAEGEGEGEGEGEECGVHGGGSGGSGGAPGAGSYDGAWELAWEWGKRALSVRNKLYGEGSSPSLEVQALLAHVAGAGMGAWAVAEPLLVSLAAVRAEELGAAHPGTQAAAACYVHLMVVHNRLRTADNFLRRMLPQPQRRQRGPQRMRLQQLQQQRQQEEEEERRRAHDCAGSAAAAGPATAVESSPPPARELPLAVLQRRLEELKRRAAQAAQASTAAAPAPSPVSSRTTQAAPPPRPCGVPKPPYAASTPQQVPGDPLEHPPPPRVEPDLSPCPEELEAAAADLRTGDPQMGSPVPAPLGLPLSPAAAVTPGSVQGAQHGREALSGGPAGGGPTSQATPLLLFQPPEPEPVEMTPEPPRAAGLPQLAALRPVPAPSLEALIRSALASPDPPPTSREVGLEQQRPLPAPGPAAHEQGEGGAAEVPQASGPEGSMVHAADEAAAASPGSDAGPDRGAGAGAGAPPGLVQRPPPLLSLTVPVLLQGGSAPSPAGSEPLSCEGFLLSPTESEAEEDEEEEARQGPRAAAVEGTAGRGSAPHQSLQLPSAKVEEEEEEEVLTTGARSPLPLKESLDMTEEHPAEMAQQLPPAEDANTGGVLPSWQPPPPPQMFGPARHLGAPPPPLPLPLAQQLPLPSMQDPLPSLAMSPAAAPARIAPDSPALSWTSLSSSAQQRLLQLPLAVLFGGGATGGSEAGAPWVGAGGEAALEEGIRRQLQLWGEEDAAYPAPAAVVAAAMAAAAAAAGGAQGYSDGGGRWPTSRSARQRACTLSPVMESRSARHEQTGPADPWGVRGGSQLRGWTEGGAPGATAAVAVDGRRPSIASALASSGGGGRGGSSRTLFGAGSSSIGGGDGRSSGWGSSGQLSRLARRTSDSHAGSSGGRTARSGLGTGREGGETGSERCASGAPAPWPRKEEAPPDARFVPPQPQLPPMLPAVPDPASGEQVGGGAAQVQPWPGDAFVGGVWEGRGRGWAWQDKSALSQLGVVKERGSGGGGVGPVAAAVDWMGGEQGAGSIALCGAAVVVRASRGAAYGPGPGQAATPAGVVHGAAGSPVPALASAHTVSEKAGAAAAAAATAVGPGGPVTAGKPRQWTAAESLGR